MTMQIWPYLEYYSLDPVQTTQLKNPEPLWEDLSRDRNPFYCKNVTTSEDRPSARNLKKIPGFPCFKGRATKSVSLVVLINAWLPIRKRWSWVSHSSKCAPVVFLWKFGFNFQYFRNESSIFIAYIFAISSLAFSYLTFFVKATYIQTTRKYSDAANLLLLTLQYYWTMTTKKRKVSRLQLK